MQRLIATRVVNRCLGLLGQPARVMNDVEVYFPGLYEQHQLIAIQHLAAGCCMLAGVTCAQLSVRALNSNMIKKAACVLCKTTSPSTRPTTMTDPQLWNPSPANFLTG